MTSLLGGLLILILGVLYLAFEKSLLVQTAPSKEALSAAKADGLSRSILGVQVGLVGLAMLVTRSSVASLQAKQGLPLGTQLVGWVTLGKLLSINFLLFTPPICTQDFLDNPRNLHPYVGLNRTRLHRLAIARSTIVRTRNFFRHRSLLSCLPNKWWYHPVASLPA